MEDNNIPDQLTYHEPQPHPHQPKGWIFTVSRIISAVFTPFMVPIVAFLLLFFFTFLKVLPMQYKLRILLLVYIFTILIPMLGIYLYQRIVGNGLKELFHREKRYIPYMFTILSYSTCVISMYRSHLPRYMVGIVLSTLICMVVCALINMKWKISTHTASSGMIVGGMLSFCFIFQFNPVGWLCVFLLLSGMLGTARILLQQHTFGEVMVGFFVGLLCGFAGILFLWDINQIFNL